MVNLSRKYCNPWRFWGTCRKGHLPPAPADRGLVGSAILQRWYLCATLKHSAAHGG